MTSIPPLLLPLGSTTRIGQTQFLARRPVEARRYVVVTANKNSTMAYYLNRAMLSETTLASI